MTYAIFNTMHSLHVTVVCLTRVTPCLTRVT